MEKTWRWFGKKDKITLDMLRQIGVEGIVTALHDVPNGEIWTEEAINDLKTYIESYGLRWSVVESLPVCEAIKYAGPEREQLIENYKVSLANLGKCGVKTVCYNFMPVIDWIRTDLQHPWADGTSSLYFDRVRFAYFDLRILGREGAIITTIPPHIPFGSKRSMKEQTISFGTHHKLSLIHISCHRISQVFFHLLIEQRHIILRFITHRDCFHLFLSRSRQTYPEQQ